MIDEIYVGGIAGIAAIMLAVGVGCSLLWGQQSNTNTLPTFQEEILKNQLIQQKADLQALKEYQPMSAGNENILAENEELVDFPNSWALLDDQILLALDVQWWIIDPIWLARMITPTVKLVLAYCTGFWM
jgi:hypothetical protein